MSTIQEQLAAAASAVTAGGLRPRGTESPVIIARDVYAPGDLQKTKIAFRSRASNEKLSARLYALTIEQVEAASVSEFRKVWEQCGGPSSSSARLLTAPTHNAKAMKSKRPEYILHLAPHRVAGVGSVCEHSTKGCRELCLFYSGRAAQFKAVNDGRLAKTLAAFVDPAGFVKMLVHELALLGKKDKGSGALRPFVRLNGTADLDWSRVEPVARAIYSAYSRRDFYAAEYTKTPVDLRASFRWYPLARSIWVDVPDAVNLAAGYLRAGEKVAIIKHGFNPVHWGLNVPGVVDASVSDEWLLDPAARLGLLTAKRPARSWHGFDVYQVQQIIREGLGV